MIKRLHKTAKTPIVRHYICICPTCGEMFECTDEDIVSKFISIVYHQIECPNCESIIFVEDNDVILSRITDASGKEIVKFAQTM